MKQIYTVINRKGGTSKSVSATNLAASLKRKGERVLLIDLDQQGSSIDMLGGSAENSTITEVIKGEMSLIQAIQQTPYTDLITADTALAGIDEYIKQERKILFLKQALKEIEDQYDFVIFDCSGELSQLNLSALMASTKVIIPALASVLSLKGIEDLNEFVDLARELGNSDLKIEGILLTQYDGRNRLSREVRAFAQELAQQLNSKLFDTPIRRTVKVEESVLSHQPIIEYDPTSTASLDYLKWTEELIGED